MSMKSVRLCARCIPLLALFLLAGCGDDEKKYEGPALPAEYQPEKIEPNPIVKISTSMGDMEGELYENDAPNTVNNFMALLKLPAPFYNGSTVLEVHKDERIVFGKTAGPGWTIPEEITGNPNKMEKYTVCMDDKGAKFYIVSGKKLPYYYEGRHTVFGKVIKGTEVIDKINDAPLSEASKEKPRDDIRINSISIVKERNHTYFPAQKVMDPTPPDAPQRPQQIQVKPQAAPQKVEPAKTDPRKPDAKADVKKEEKKPEEKK